MAVVKNNAYGLGVIEVASLLDGLPEIWGLALVRAEDAFAVRQAGVRCPILLMAGFSESEGEELVRSNVTLSVFDDDDPAKIRRLADRLGRKIGVHLYVDTGLGRMGRLHSRVFPWLDQLMEWARLKGAFTMLTSDDDFAREQVSLFRRLKTGLIERGIEPGLFHAASSAPALHQPESHFDAVRPGILLHGSLPGGGPGEAALIDLKLTFRLRARIVRLERLPAGSTIGFSRFYPIKEPTWIATVPIGWGDGYPSAAENGALALGGSGRMFKVVNVNSNHTNLLVGDEKVAAVGDVVTLMGPDAAKITPEGMAQRIGGHNYVQIDFKDYIPKFVL